MKTKTSNARKSVEFTDVTALSAAVHEVDTHLYVSQNTWSAISNCVPFLQI
jgi:hypothetical protein